MIKVDEEWEWYIGKLYTKLIKGHCDFKINTVVEFAPGFRHKIANALKDLGATNVYACCTHGVLGGPAMERLIASPIKEIVVLDTINLPENVRNNPKIKVLSVAKLVAKAITTIYADTSLSAIYED